MLKILKYAFIIIVLAVAALSFITVSYSKDAVKVVLVKGDPKIMKTGTDEWTSCSIGMVVDNGDRIKTLKDEIVEIAFTKKGPNIVRVEESADVFVKKNEPPYSVELLNGAVMASIKNLPRHSTFEVRTPAGLSGARGTAWRADTDGKRATFDAYDRSIFVKGIDEKGNEMAGELTLESGSRVSMERFERPERVERLTDRDMDRWNDWKQDLRARAGEIEKRASEMAAAAASHAMAPATDNTRLDSADKSSDKIVDRIEAQQENVIQTTDSTKIEQRLEGTHSSGSCS